MSTIHEIASELERLASEISAINLRPFGERIDLRQGEVDTPGDDDEDSQSPVVRLDS